MNIILVISIWIKSSIDKIIITGVAGTDYSVYASVPETGFDCNVQEFPGIYSDTEAECQVFHCKICFTNQ